MPPIYWTIIPGKPLTPYHTKRERQRVADEAAEARARKENRGIFLDFREPRRFSACRDNCQVIDKNNEMRIRDKSWISCNLSHIHMLTDQSLPLANGRRGHGHCLNITSAVQPERALLDGLYKLLKIEINHSKCSYSSTFNQSVVVKYIYRSRTAILCSMRLKV